MPWAEKLPSGKYRGLYRDRAGRRRSAGTFTQKRAAEKAATIAEDAARKLGWRDPDAANMLWADWVTAWWPTRAVEPGTLKVDRSRLNARLAPRWADVPLVDITRQDVRAWIADLQRSKLAPATVQRCVSLLSASLAAAVDAEIITTNVASRIKVVQGEIDPERYLTRPEFAAIAAALTDPFDEALASLLVGTGMRWGEAIGLMIPRIDFGRGRIQVAETWDDRMQRVKPYPKGRRIRRVPLVPWVAAHIEPVVDGRATGHLWERRGRLPDYHNWRARIWVPALKVADVGHVRIHDLRHTYASWLIQDGVPLAEVGALLGHMSPVTTQRYAHLQDDRSDDRITAALTDPRGASVGQDDTAERYATLHPIAARTAQSRG